MFRIPAVIQSGITHGVVGRERLFVPIDDSWNTREKIKFGNVFKPLVSRSVAATFFCDVDITHAPKTVSFGGDGIIDHALADFVTGAVNPANKKHDGEFCTRERLILFEVGVIQWARCRNSLYAHHGKF